MSGISDRIRPGLRELQPYQPGKPIEDVQRELGLERVMKLASNEYPEGAFAEVQEALREEITRTHRYPDAGWHELLDAVTEVYPLDREEILFGNGANEILELLVHLLVGPGDEVVFAQPSFPIYGLLSQSHFNGGRAVPLDADLVHDLPAMAEAVTDRTRLVFLCNPNNPTGTYFSETALLEFMDRVPERVLVVLDEAYAEFVTAEDYPRYFELRQRFENLVSVRSFSKIYSLAALRIGYCMGSREVISWLQRVRQPFNVNRLAQRAAALSIRRQDLVAERRATNRRRMVQLREGMEALGCRVIPSQANFYLVFAPGGSEALFDGLLQAGVIVRPMRGFGVSESAFRVNVGCDDENAGFLDALRDVLAAVAR
jgi:histidinol-phosphate aminotransferase